MEVVDARAEVGVRDEGELELRESRVKELRFMMVWRGFDDCGRVDAPSSCVETISNSNGMGCVYRQ